jgi:hypothetical protein
MHIPDANIRTVDETQTRNRETNARTLRQRHLIAMPHWVLRGLLEMFRARLQLARIAPGDIASLNAGAGTTAGAKVTSMTASIPQSQAIERVAFIIALLGRKLPWRSDCLIQAIAGRRWLLRLGIETKITIGVEQPEGGGFGAHAWLVHGETVILGGNIDRYRILIGET